MRKEKKTVPLRTISRNDGQLDWLPKNPRQWTKDDADRTARSIIEDTDFLEDRPLLLVPDHKDGRFIVFAGNLRREGAKAAGMMEVPCVVYYPQNDEDKVTIKRRAMKDNGSFGSWDFDLLANEWDDFPLTDWGVPAWETNNPSDMGLSTEGRTGEEGYDEFVDKFKQKLTTDDCYTPPEVYDALLGWIDGNIKPIDRGKIVRPFFPGGDYINHKYPEGCIVIDNPPFSIFSEIVRFYAEKNIPFFLFGPSLTLFVPGKLPGVCYIVCNYSVEYENGAVVATSFVTNIIGGDDLIWVRGDLRESLGESQKKDEPERGKYDLPDNVVSSARIGKICTNPKCDLRIKSNEAVKIKQLDGLKDIGKGLYGVGFLIGRAAAERAAAERAAAERAAAERAAAERAAIKIQLSPREQAIVSELSPNSSEGG